MRKDKIKRFDFAKKPHKPCFLFQVARKLESMHIEYDYLGRGDCIDISIPDDSFWCYLSKRDAIT